MAVVQNPAREQSENRPGLGSKRDRRGPVALCSTSLGRQSLEEMAVMGHALSSGADEKSRQNNQRAPVGHPQCHHPEGNQRSGRKHQQPDKNDQGQESRLPQQGTLS